MPKQIFSIVLYKGKMAEIRLKMSIKCLKMVKMTSNLDTICIMIIFIHFLNFVKICRKMVIFWQKNRHFLDFTSRFPLFNFRRKTYQVLGKWSNWANFWYKCSLGYLLQKLGVTFGYLVFLTFYRARYVQRGLFFANFGKFWPKKALFAHIGPYKM